MKSQGGSFRDLGLGFRALGVRDLGIEGLGFWDLGLGFRDKGWV